MGKILGIDFGTDNVTVSYMDEIGVLHTIITDEGLEYTPTDFFYDNESRSVLVGESARQEGSLSPEKLITRIKLSLQDEKFQKRIGNRAFSAVDVVTVILTAAVRCAEEYLGGEEISGAVISCPIQFGERELELMKAAASQASLSDGSRLATEVVRDPIAAAMANYVTEENVDKRVLVYDLGGTFDATLLDVKICGGERSFDIVASCTDRSTGGREWDNELKEYVIYEFCSLTGADHDEIANDSDMRVWFSDNIQRAKIILSKKAYATLTMAFNGEKEKITVTREAFDDITRKHLERTIGCVKGMLERNGLGNACFDEILLVGRATRMPQIKERLEAEFGRVVILSEPDKLVSFGAALFGNGALAPSVIVLSDDDIPYSVGIMTKSHEGLLASNVICKGSNITARATRSFYTSTEGQPAIILRVVKKNVESENVGLSDCNEEYKPVCIALTPGLPAGSRVDVTFSFNQSKQLELEICETESGKSSTVVPEPIEGSAEAAIEELISSMYLGIEDAETINKRLSRNYIGIDIGSCGFRVSCINEKGVLSSIEMDGNGVNLPYAIKESMRTNEGCTVLFGRDAELASELSVGVAMGLQKKMLNYSENGNGAEDLGRIFCKIIAEAVDRAVPYLNGAQVNGAAVSCPPHFGSSLRRLLMDAAENAKRLCDLTFDRVELVDEVTASVLSYLDVNPLEGDKRLLAIDLGLSLKASVMDIVSAGSCVRIDPVASVGLTSYGGDIFNEILGDYVSRTYYDSTGEFLDGLWEDEYERRRLEERIEAAKRRLSRLDVVRIPVRYNGESCNVEIRRSDFARDSERICIEMARALDKELADSGVDLSQLDGILLMGGASEMPVIKTVLSEYFGIPVTVFLHECAVADGAAIAARAYATEDPALSIGRISPYSVGLKAYLDGKELIANVVLKNTRLPISEVRTFATVYENMPLLTLGIYENSSVKSTVSPNECDSEERLVNVNLERGLPAGTAIDMTFCVDENGLLDITVKDCVTSVEKKVT